MSFKEFSSAQDASSKARTDGKSTDAPSAEKSADIPVKTPAKAASTAKS